MKKAIMILLLFIYYTTFSQDSSSNKVNQIYFKAFSGWKMDGKRLTIKNLKSEIYKVPATIPAYTKSEKNRTIGYVCFISGSILALLSPQVSDIASPRFGKNNTAFKIGGVVFMGTAIYCLFRSKKQLKASVRIHNESQPLIY